MMDMKPSGIQWIGDIPCGWKLGKVKNQFYCTKTIVGDKVDDYERLALTLNGVIKRSKEANEGLQPEKFDGYQVLKKNELVFKLIDLENVATSRVGLSPYTGIVSPAYIVLHDRQEGCPKYAEYYFLSMWMHEVFNHLGGDGVRSSLNAKDLLDVPFLLIPEAEQQAIADYLDDRCAKIDAIIAGARASIDEYKQWKSSIIYEAVTKGLDPSAEMVDSGINWIGKMPKSWYVCMAKNVVNISHGTDPKTEGDIPVYGSGAGSFKTCGEYKEGPAVLIGRKGATLHIPHYIEGKYWNVDTAFDVKPKTASYDLKYYYYLATCFDYKYYMSQTTLPSMTQSDYNGMKLPIPSIEEQMKIVDYLDQKCIYIDSIIAEKEALIFDLDTYKKSLIFEVVTGKQKVC